MNPLHDSMPPLGNGDLIGMGSPRAPSPWEAATRGGASTGGGKKGGERWRAAAAAAVVSERAAEEDGEPVDLEAMTSDGKGGRQMKPTARRVQVGEKPLIVRSEDDLESEVMGMLYRARW